MKSAKMPAFAALLLLPLWCSGAPLPPLSVDGLNPACDDAVGAPYCTIGAAVADAASGTTIEVAAGTYTETVVFFASKTLTLVGAGAATTVIDAGGLDRGVEVWGNANISGFTIQNGNAGTSGLGGGIAVLTGTLTLSDSIVKASTAADGAGIFADGSNVTITRTLITGNNSVADVGSVSSGGAIYVSGTVTITDSTLSNNTADIAGGIFNLGSLTITNSTLSGNEATATNDGGGALYNGSGSSADATLNNVTIAANSSASSYGGIYNMNGTVTLRNSIVAGNTAASSPNCGGQSLTSRGHNVMGTLSGCNLSAGTGDVTNLTTSQVGLSPLANNGGATPTRALLSGSPAIDNGDNATCSTTDQRGEARVDGNGDGTATCDSGAFELQYAIIVNGDASPMQTSEGGDRVHLQVFLSRAPTADVTLTISSSDTSEGTLSPSTLTFTTTNWNEPQTVTVTGVDDTASDGDKAYTIDFGAADSADANYGGMQRVSVNLSNVDDEETSGDGGGGAADLLWLALLAAGLGARRRLLTA